MAGFLEIIKPHLPRCEPPEIKLDAVTELDHSYAFDVDPSSNAFKNRRVFAYVDTGIADGIQLDADGNVYGGCGDGVQVSSARAAQALTMDSRTSQGMEFRRNLAREIFPWHCFC